MTSVRNNALPAALLLGWVIFGCLNYSALAAAAQKSSERAQGEDSQVDIDYDESLENGNATVRPEPGNLKATVKPTLMPYFDEEKKITYSKEGSQVLLKCPAKNYNDAQHVIMWYKSENAITSGKVVLVDAALYQLDKDNNLIINEATDKTKGDYYCTIMPQEIRMKIVLKIGEQPPNADNKQMMVSASALCLLLALLVRELSSGFANFDHFF